MPGALLPPSWGGEGGEGGEGGKCDRLGPWLGKRTRQCRQRRHHARPSPPTHDWVLRPLTRRASSSAPHVQGGLLSFPLGREEAMAAMASFGALALLLLSGLSCCSGSGLAGDCFGARPCPLAGGAVGGRVYARWGSGPSRGSLLLAGSFPDGCCVVATKVPHTRLPGSQVAGRNSLVCFWESPKAALSSDHQLQQGR